MSCQASGLTGDGAHIRCGLPRADTAAEWRVVASGIGIADHCAGTHWCAIVTSRCRERRASVVARPVRSTARVTGRSERVSDLVPTCKRTHLAVVARLALTTAGSIAGRAVCTLDPAIHGTRRMCGNGGVCRLPASEPGQALGRNTRIWIGVVGSGVFAVQEALRTHRRHIAIGVEQGDLARTSIRVVGGDAGLRACGGIVRHRDRMLVGRATWSSQIKW